MSDFDLEGSSASRYVGPESDLAGYWNHWYNSGLDQIDNLGVYFDLFDFTQRNHPNLRGDALTHFNNKYDLYTGDKIWFTVKIPFQRNPWLIVEPDVAQNSLVLYPSMNTYVFDQTTGSYVNAAGSCVTQQIVQIYDPGDVVATSNLTFGDCDATMEHRFEVSNPPPVNWYVNEYRPLFNLDSIEAPMPSPFFYQGNAEVIDYLGNSTPVTRQDYTNQNCVNVSGTEYCQSEQGTTGTNIFGGEDFPMLGVGLGNDDHLTLRYDFGQVCPGQVGAMPDFKLDYNFAFENEFDASGYWYLNRPHEHAFPADTDLSFYFVDYLDGNDLHEYSDSSFVLTVNDNSNDFPILSNTVTQNVLFGSATTTEINTYEVCAANTPGTAVHENVLTTFRIPSPIELINVFDENDNPLTIIPGNAAPDYSSFAVAMPDIAAGECVTIKVETRLLYCAEGNPAVQITTTSSCNSPEVTAALSANGTDACASAFLDYNYSTEEAGIQAEWVEVDPVGFVDVCDTITFTVRIKNVKAGLVGNVVPTFWLPMDGMEYVPGSWQSSYPHGPVVQSPWQSIPDPTANPARDNSHGYAHEYTDASLWSPYIDANGLPGVGGNAAVTDSNKVAFRFQVITECNSFISGSVLSFESQATNGCGETLTSGAQSSPFVVIDMANPEDFAQFLTVAEPNTLNCGAEDVELVIKAFNLSDAGTGDSTLMCLTFPEGIEYQPNSLEFDVPTFTPINTMEMTMGSTTIVGFDLPDSLAAGQFFQVKVRVNLSENVDCGTVGFRHEYYLLCARFGVFYDG